MSYGDPGRDDWFDAMIALAILVLVVVYSVRGSG